nr:hypothetical protein GCM10025732_55440 [Glycomyces mayteni]
MGRVRGLASGGFFADSRFSGRVVSGSQQQFFTRNSNLQGGWAGSVWNMVFVGTGGAPAHHFPDPSHTVVDRAPVIREKPFLYTASDGEFRVFKPAVRRDAAGTSWEGGAPAGTSISLAEFYVVNPGEDVATVNRALAEGRHLLFTPGVHEFDQTLNVTAPGTVVLGLGLATIIPTGGQTAIAVADVDGAVIAGPSSTPGRPSPTSSSRSARPAPPPTTARTRSRSTTCSPASAARTRLRAGQPGDQLPQRHRRPPVAVARRPRRGGRLGRQPGRERPGRPRRRRGRLRALRRALPGVPGGLGGERGRTYFFQNEMPYDPPDQASWRSGANGWASYKVDDSVAEHALWGGGGYCFFNVDPGVVCDRVFETPSHGGIRLTSLVSVSLGGVGTIRRVVNETGDQVDAGSFTSYVVAYP